MVDFQEFPGSCQGLAPKMEVSPVARHRRVGVVVEAQVLVFGEIEDFVPIVEAALGSEADVGVCSLDGSVCWDDERPSGCRPCHLGRGSMLVLHFVGVFGVAFRAYSAVGAFVFVLGEEDFLFASRSVGAREGVEELRLHDWRWRLGRRHCSWRMCRCTDLRWRGSDRGCRGYGRGRWKDLR